MTIMLIRIASLLSAFALLGGAQAHAQLAPIKQSVAPSAADGLASQSIQAELTGNHEKALQLANDAIKADPKNPWGHYDGGDALESLKRIDDAVSAFRQAEQYFSDADVWGKSVAIWGQANVFRQLGRCQDAVPIYERYATFLEKLDPDAAALARTYEKSCGPSSKSH